LWYGIDSVLCVKIEQDDCSLREQSIAVQLDCSNNKKFHNIRHQKTNPRSQTLNPNPDARFYQVKLENYGINVTLK